MRGFSRFRFKIEIESICHLEADYMWLKLGSFWTPPFKLGFWIEIVISSWDSLKWSIELWMILIPPLFSKPGSYWIRLFLKPGVYWIRWFLKPKLYWIRLFLKTGVYWIRLFLKPGLFWTRVFLKPGFFWIRYFLKPGLFFESDFFWNLDHCQSEFWIERWIMLNPVFDIWNLVSDSTSRFWKHIFVWTQFRWFFYTSECGIGHWVSYICK